MENVNVCKFNITRGNSEEFNVLNFVYEKNAPPHPNFTIDSVFRMYLIADGEGSFNTFNKSIPLRVGDIIMTMPATDYCIHNTGQLKFLYISFIGLRAERLFERAGLNRDDCIRNGYADLLPLWKDGVEFAAENNIDLIAEGILLYTLGKIFLSRGDSAPENKTENCVLVIKKQMEDRFSDPALGLQMLCAECFYNPKYVSAVFKKRFGIGFSEYLLDLRMNNALRLFENGFTSVKEVAALSGFSEPLYFSKVFKKKTGVSPKEYIVSRPANAPMQSEKAAPPRSFGKQ